MSSNERRKQIVEFASQERELSIEQLQRLFNVSEVTLRRDLGVLESQGYLRRVRGGAVLNDAPELEVKFQEKLELNTSHKREIAKAAAAMVKEGQVVMLSGGTTTMYIARELCKMKSITVVTPAVNIAAELAGYASVSLVMIGGIVRNDSYVASGHLADEALASMYADFAFVGVNGVDLVAGFTTPNIVESRTDRTMLQSAAQRIIVADHSKLGELAFSPVARLDEVTLLITDGDAPKEYVEQLRDAGCTVILAGKPTLT